MRQYQAIAWVGHIDIDLFPSQAQAECWHLSEGWYSEYLSIIFFQGYFLEVCNTTEILHSQEGKSGSRDHGRAKKMILTMHSSAGISGFKICPLSTSKSPNHGKWRIV